MYQGKMARWPSKVPFSLYTRKQGRTIRGLWQLPQGEATIPGSDLDRKLVLEPECVACRTGCVPIGAAQHHLASAWHYFCGLPKRRAWSFPGVSVHQGRGAQAF